MCVDLKGTYICANGKDNRNNIYEEILLYIAADTFTIVYLLVNSCCSLLCTLRFPKNYMLLQGVVFFFVYACTVLVNRTYNNTFFKEIADKCVIWCLMTTERLQLSKTHSFVI